MIYKKLIDLSEQLESMISDGVQLVHGGHLFDWSDTVIIDLLEEIKEERETIESQSTKPGDILINLVTKEEMTVIKTDKNNVYIEPVSMPLEYSKNKIWEHYKPKKRA
ncbi:MAG: hypothetical protein D3914_05650 [Candidatus Electrothrix sp. LOE2]|jgi:hypothetical protein|nr:hypothetical protein [Candidatus Electrothrix sp. LOE2]